MQASQKDTPVRSVYWKGRRQSTLRRSDAPQDFYAIRKKCLASGELFKDAEFAASDKSIFFSRPADRCYEWLRPHEICNDPQFFVEGFSRFDVQQGSLSDCWLLAATANLTQDRKLFERVVFDDNSFKENYAGIFHFRFWQYNKWVEVVIDDRLPTYCGRLVFMRSSERNEFWSALLEKAYAKLHGSYESLNGGTTSEAFQDFTGGITEMYQLERAPPSLYKIMLRAFESYSMMSCCIQANDKVAEEVTPNGLVRGHAYSITRVQFVDVKAPRTGTIGKVPLVRLRNPWGDETEWTGAWSDKSPHWSCVSASTKEELGLTLGNDGEFWMSFEDFLKNFERLEICNLSPEFTPANGEDPRNWHVNVFEGEWAKASAGGCRMHLDTFWQNPQYVVTLSDPDENDEEGKCTIVIALMQKNRRNKKNIGLDFLVIGFTVYQVSESELKEKPLSRDFFAHRLSYASVPVFINMREVSGRFKFSPGSYVVVPSTFEPAHEGEFLIRVFTESRHTLEENEWIVGERRREDEDARIPAALDEFNAEKTFKDIAGDETEIGWKEVKKILDRLVRDVEPHGISKDICRSMVAMLDVDRSGKLGMDEFKVLINEIIKWKTIFKKFDKDNSNTLDGGELRAALLSAGFYPNNRVLNSMIYRYGTHDKTLAFDDFVMCAVKMKTSVELFKSKDLNNQRQILISLDEWIAISLYS